MAFYSNNAYFQEAACYAQKHINGYQTYGDINNYVTRNTDKLYNPYFDFARGPKGER